MPKLFLLPGHFDAHDPGAVANGIEERTMALHFAHLCLETLLPLKLFAAILLPQAQAPLAERINWVNAQASAADYLLSLHFNAAENEQAEGIEAWINDEKTATRQQAEILLEQISKCTQQKVRGVKSDDQNRLGRLGILHTKPLGCLLELGFITNPAEAELIKRISFPNKVAKGIAKAYQALLKGPQKIKTRKNLLARLIR